MKVFLKFSPCYFRQDFKYRDFHEDSTESERLDGTVLEAHCQGIADI